MADLSLQAESACAMPSPQSRADAFTAIIDQAQEIQTLANRVGHLADAISRMAESVCSSQRDKATSHTVGGVIAFADLAEELVRKIADTAETIEITTNKARRA